LATSKCPRCDSTRFEAARATISGTYFPYMFIQCASCGTVVGASEAENVSNLVHQLAEKLGVS
jgi:hypothetical protein